MKLLSNAWTMARTTGRVFFSAVDAPARYGEKGSAGATEDLTNTASADLNNFREAAKPRSREAAKPRSREAAKPRSPFPCPPPRLSASF